MQTHTLHLDGYNPFLEDDEEFYHVVVRFIVDGKPSDIIASEIVFSAPRTEENLLRQQRAYLLSLAACQCLNTGGDRFDLYQVIDRFSSMEQVTPAFEPLAVLAPDTHAVIVYRKDDKHCIKVVVGENGFTESLTPQEVLDTFGDGKAVRVEETEEI